jgi:hypothetical protein
MILAMGMSHHQWLGRRCSVTEEGPNRAAITIIDALEYLCRVNVRLGRCRTSLPASAVIIPTTHSTALNMRRLTRGPFAPLSPGSFPAWLR